MCGHGTWMVKSPLICNDCPCGTPKPLPTSLRVSTRCNLAFSDSVWGQNWERMTEYDPHSCPLVLRKDPQQSVTSFCFEHPAIAQWGNEELWVPCSNKLGHLSLQGGRKQDLEPKENRKIWRHAPNTKWAPSSKGEFYFSSSLWVRIQRIYSKQGGFCINGTVPFRGAFPASMDSHRGIFLVHRGALCTGQCIGHRPERLPGWLGWQLRHLEWSHSSVISHIPLVCPPPPPHRLGCTEWRYGQSACQLPKEKATLEEAGRQSGDFQKSKERNGAAIEWQSQDRGCVRTTVHFMGSVSLHHSQQVGIPPLSVMLLGGGAFGSWCRSWGWSLHEWVHCLYKKRSLWVVSHLSLCEEARGSPLVDTMRSQQSTTQRRVLSRTGPSWHPDPGLSASRTVRNKFLSFVSHSVCSALS